MREIEVSPVIQDAFDRYVDTKGLHCLESVRGLRALNTMLSDLTDYTDLEDMLMDNSDLIKLIFDYVKGLSVYISEIRDNILQYAVNETDNDSDSEDNE